MPASTLDPVNAALRSSLANKGGNEGSLDNQLAGAAKKALLADVEFESAGSYQSTVLDKLKNKYIVLKGSESPQPSSKPEVDAGADGESLKSASYELYPIESVQLGWSKCDWSVGAGMINMGNTCYLNSTLQALFHVPALVNWLMSDKEHTAECQDSGGLCIICAMRKTLQDSQQRNTTTIRPILIYNKLRVVCRNLIPGRQEDAHEFLRYLVEAMEKSYLSRFKNHMEFDSKVKETTPLNQILGGYLRSAVRCLKCGHVSTTFQHFQDLLLDIRKAQTLDEALEGYFSREKLDDESYHCQSCQKKVPATKQFSLEKAPMVLCIQLKRFSVSNNKITKHIQFRQRLDLTRYARHRPNVPLIYRLVALVTHMGPNVNCGHYTAVAQAPTGNFYQFDDSMVRVISHQAVFNTNAYIMLYELESSPFAQKPSPNTSLMNKSKLVTTTTTTTTEQHQLLNNNNNNALGKTSNNGIGFTSDKVYGPELPPDKKININGVNGKHKNSSDSDQENSPKKENKPLNNNLSSSSSSSSSLSNSNNNNNELNKPLVPLQQSQENSIKQQKDNLLLKQQKDNIKTKDIIIKAKENNLKKLVPYESDDSTSSDDTYPVITKATVGNWKVSSSNENIVEPSSQGKSWEKKKENTNNNNNINNNNNNNNNVVSELFKMSHSGYAAPVSSWSGNRAQLDKDVNNERREERKRALSDNLDQGRVKHQKTSHSFKSNPGYNPIQEYHNAKNWGQNNSVGHHKHFNKGGNRYRRNFHHKGFHNKNFRFRQ